jgi:hypothetical protein
MCPLWQTQKINTQKIFQALSFVLIQTMMEAKAVLLAMSAIRAHRNFLLKMIQETPM